MKKNYVDFSQAYKKIGNVKKSAETVASKGVNIAAEYAEKELIKKTPRYDTSTSDNIHAKDHTAIKKATKNDLTAQVGFDKEVAWRVHFVEFGTIRQKPQPFIQRTIRDVEDEVADIIQKYLKEALS